MGFESKLGAYRKQQLLDSTNGEFGELERPGWLDVHKAQAGITGREELSHSAASNVRAERIPRNQKIDDDIASGVIDENTAQMFAIERDRRRRGGEHRHNVDYDGMARHLQAQGLDYDTDADIDANIRESLRVQREADMAVIEEAGPYAQFFGQLTGAGSEAMLKDPINLMSMAIPGAQYKAGASVFNTFLRTGANAAVANAAAETAIQAFVLPYKEDIESPYTWQDSIFNIGAGAVFGAAIGGTVGGAVAYFRNNRIAELSADLDRQVADLEARIGDTTQAEQAGTDAPVQATVQPDAQAGTQVAEPGTAGGGTVRTAAGTEVDFEWKVVDASTLKTSDAAEFDANLQPRDRAKPEMQGQVDEIARKLDPESLGSSRGAESGAPIIGPDGTVESGNGRVMAIRRAKELYGDRYDEYRGFVERVTGQDTAGMETPVLVRRRTTELTPDELRQFTIEANKGAQAAFDAAEIGRADAALLDDAMLGKYQGGDVSLERNAPFVAAVLDAMPAGERNALSADGRITPEGVTRLRNMLMARAYSGTADGDKLLRQLAVSSDDNARTISGALTDAAGRMAQLRDAVKGTPDADFDIGAQVIEALSVVQQLRRDKVSASEWLQQTDMLTTRNPVVDELVRIFFDEGGVRGVSRQKIGKALDAYADLAYSRMGTEDLFGGGNKPADLLAEARGIAQGIDVDVANLAAARVAADAARKQVQDPSPNDVTPDDIAQVNARLDDVDTGQTMVDADGNTVNMQAYIDEAEARAKAADEVITCMLGGASG